MEQSSQNRFAMIVQDVFLFLDGRTVFLGEVPVGPAFIGPGQCELLIAGVLFARFRIEGEMIIVRRGRSSLRSVSTTERIDVEWVKCARESAN